MRYENPVYAARNFPDPFVLKYAGEYWAYCTGPWPDGRWFGILRSRDLIHWHDIGGALEPLPGPFPCQWAPEVTYHNGRFYLYYSLGDEATMQIRVATASHPAGPFTDSGHVLTNEPFAIDAHVFTDDDGSRYLFYATDFLDHTHVGTGTARVRLRDWFTTDGQVSAVSRPRHDWHVYDPHRTEKGGVRWHTIEGSFVLKHRGRYVQMFSGGNWQNPSYGVSYATTDDISSPHEWAQHADGITTLPILRTIPGHVIGPGHNSVVRAPDNRTLVCVYHRWTDDLTARVLAIDPLVWEGDDLVVHGPSTGPAHLPVPTAADWFDGTGARLGAVWHTSGGWERCANRAYAVAFPARARRATPADFVAELSVCASDGTGAGFGVLLEAAGRVLARIAVLPAEGYLLLETDTIQRMPLPADTDYCVIHLLRLTVAGCSATIAFDAHTVHGELAASPDTLALWADQPAAFAGFALTEGWQESDLTATSLVAHGWQLVGHWHATDGCIAASDGALWRGGLPERYVYTATMQGDASIAPADDGAGGGPIIARAGDALLVAGHAAHDDLSPHSGASTLTATRRIALPAACAALTWLQLRCVVGNGTIDLWWRTTYLGSLPLEHAPARVGVLSHGGTIAALHLAAERG